MAEDTDHNSDWPTPADYGRRYEDFNARLGRSFALAEFQGESAEATFTLQYHLAKIAIAAEDLGRAIMILAREGSTDDDMAKAIVELRNACTEIGDTFVEADPALVGFLNFLSG